MSARLERIHEELNLLTKELTSSILSSEEKNNLLNKKQKLQEEFYTLLQAQQILKG